MHIHVRIWYNGCLPFELRVYSAYPSLVQPDLTFRLWCKSWLYSHHPQKVVEGKVKENICWWMSLRWWVIDHNAFYHISNSVALRVIPLHLSLGCFSIIDVGNLIVFFFFSLLFLITFSSNKTSTRTRHSSTCWGSPIISIRVGLSDKSEEWCCFGGMTLILTFSKLTRSVKRSAEMSLTSEIWSVIFIYHKGVINFEHTNILLCIFLTFKEDWLSKSPRAFKRASCTPPVIDML